MDSVHNPFALNAVFRFTRAGCTVNPATGRINAEALHDMPRFDGFIVTAFDSSDQHNDVEVRFVSQKPPIGNDIICDVRLDTVMTYVTNDWIRRVDARRPEVTFPIRSVWRLTQEGASPGRVPIRRFTQNPHHNWVVLGIFLDPERHMRMTIQLENETSRENGEFMSSRYDIGMFFQWLALEWIERVDVANMDIEM